MMTGNTEVHEGASENSGKEGGAHPGGYFPVLH